MHVHRCVLGLSFVCVFAVCSYAGYAEAQDCLDCHGSKNAADMEARLVVDEEAWTESVHQEAGLQCVGCHEGKDEFPHEGGLPMACGSCHEDAGKEVARSVHAGKNGKHTATDHIVCGACHGIHDVRSADDPTSKTYIRNITQTCGKCHADTAMLSSRGLTTAPFENFRQSVHVKYLEPPQR